MTLRALDGFCGLGGWTKGLQKAGFEVDGFDIEPQPKYQGNFLQADARTFHPQRKYDVAVMSPPCTGFSSLNFLNPEFVGKRPRPIDFELLAHACRIIGEAEPRYWAVENVAGAVSWFEPIIGKPAARIAPYYLWGQFPGFVLPTSARIKTKSSIAYEVRPKDDWGRPPMRKKGGKSKEIAAAVAEIPLALSETFGRACADALGLAALNGSVAA